VKFILGTRAIHDFIRERVTKDIQFNQYDNDEDLLPTQPRC